MEENVKQWLHISDRYLVGVSVNEGVFAFRLGGADASGQSVYDVFEVEVYAPTPPFTHAITVSIDADYDTFIADDREPMAFMQRMARALNNDDAAQIVVTSVRRGSVIITWANSSLSRDSCTNTTIERLWKSVAVDNRPKDTFQGRLAPAYKVMLRTESVRCTRSYR
jgi:hypothetical protein